MLCPFLSYIQNSSKMLELLRKLVRFLLTESMLCDDWNDILLNEKAVRVLKPCGLANCVDSNFLRD